MADDKDEEEKDAIVAKLTQIAREKLQAVVDQGGSDEDLQALTDEMVRAVAQVGAEVIAFDKAKKSAAKRGGEETN